MSEARKNAAHKAANPKNAGKAKLEAVHRLHALLQTMRVIQQHEDHFCTLMHAIQNASKLTAADRRELHTLLDQMPGETLVHDLEAVRAAIAPTLTRTSPRRETAAVHAH